MEKHIDRECKKHGLTSFILEGRGYYRCKKCRSTNTSNKRKRARIKAVEYGDGKCIRCGYSKCIGALHFHHPDDNKEFSVSNKGRTISWERTKAEIDKCILVCANCHAEIHEELLASG